MIRVWYHVNGQNLYHVIDNQNSNNFDKLCFDFKPVILFACLYYFNNLSTLFILGWPLNFSDLES